MKEGSISKTSISDCSLSTMKTASKFTGKSSYRNSILIIKNSSAGDLEEFSNQPSLGSASGKHVIKNYFEGEKPLKTASHNTTPDLLLRKSRGQQMNLTYNGQSNPARLLTRKEVDKVESKDKHFENYPDVEVLRIKSPKLDMDFSSHKKVADALLVMVKKSSSLSNRNLVVGIVSALFKILRETSDLKIIVTCLLSLQEVTKVPLALNLLVTLDTIELCSTIARCSEGDTSLFIAVSRILCNITGVSDSNDRGSKSASDISTHRETHQTRAIDIFISRGLISLLQQLMHPSDDVNLARNIMLSLCNMAPRVSSADTESCFRLFMLATKKLDIHCYSNVLFVNHCFKRLSSVAFFATTLCDESGLSFIIRFIQAFPTEDALADFSETFMNLTFYKKNIREISNAKISFILPHVFKSPNKAMSRNLLIGLGNMLRGGHYHNKLSARDVISQMLSRSFYNSNDLWHFHAVSYCLAQLASHEQCFINLLHAGVIAITTDHLAMSSPLNTALCNALCADIDSSCTHQCSEYLWSIIVNLLQAPPQGESFIRNSVIHINKLLVRMRSDLSIQKDENGSKWFDHLLYLFCTFVYNISIKIELLSILNDDQIELLTSNTLVLIGIFDSPMKVMLKIVALFTLLNLMRHTPAARAVALASDQCRSLLSVRPWEKGNVAVCLKYAAILNALSADENSYPKLVDWGVRTMLSSIYSSILPAPPTKTTKQAIAAISPQSSHVTSSAHILSDVGTGFRMYLQNHFSGPDLSEDHCKTVIAATVYNVSLRAPHAVIESDVDMSMVYGLMKNTKSTRVLHCTHSLAILSTLSKTKLVLTRERPLLSVLLTAMRSGCEEADKVQNFSAIIICNLFESKVDVEVAREWFQNELINDLVVTTLLRVNSVATKECLAKALCNLMCPVDRREAMMVKASYSLLSALIDLVKSGSRDVLEVAMNLLYNLSCRVPKLDSDNYAQAFRYLKISGLLSSRIMNKNDSQQEHSYTGPSIRMLCSKILANLSCDAALCTAICERSLHNLVQSVSLLRSNDSTYCVTVILFNLSKSEQCTKFAGGNVVQQLLASLGKKFHSESLIAVAALCNLSFYSQYHTEFNEFAIAALVKILALHTPASVAKTNALHILFNLLIRHSPAARHAITNSLLPSLKLYLKHIVDEPNFTVTVRIVQSMCAAATSDKLFKKLMADGIVKFINDICTNTLCHDNTKPHIAMLLYFLIQNSDENTIVDVLKSNIIETMQTLVTSLSSNDTCAQTQNVVLKFVARALCKVTRCESEVGNTVANPCFPLLLSALLSQADEDILFFTASVLHNTLSSCNCQDAMIDLGVVGMIMTLSDTKWPSVRYMCSSVLHIISSKLRASDINDPKVIDLLLVVLQLSNYDSLRADSEATCQALLCLKHLEPIKCLFVLPELKFHPNWLPFRCEVNANESKPVTSPTYESQQISYIFKPAGGELGELSIKQSVDDVDSLTSDELDTFLSQLQEKELQRNREIQWERERERLAQIQRDLESACAPTSAASTARSHIMNSGRSDCFGIATNSYVSSNEDTHSCCGKEDMLRGRRDGMGTNKPGKSIGSRQSSRRLSGAGIGPDTNSPAGRTFAHKRYTVSDNSHRTSTSNYASTNAGLAPGGRSSIRDNNRSLPPAYAAARRSTRESTPHGVYSSTTSTSVCSFNGDDLGYPWENAKDGGLCASRDSTCTTPNLRGRGSRLQSQLALEFDPAPQLQKCEVQSSRTPTNPFPILIESAPASPLHPTTSTDLTCIAAKIGGSGDSLQVTSMLALEFDSPSQSQKYEVTSNPNPTNPFPTLTEPTSTSPLRSSTSTDSFCTTLKIRGIGDNLQAISMLALEFDSPSQSITCEHPSNSFLTPACTNHIDPISSDPYSSSPLHSSLTGPFPVYSFSANHPAPILSIPTSSTSIVPSPASPIHCNPTNPTLTSHPVPSCTIPTSLLPPTCTSTSLPSIHPSNINCCEPDENNSKVIHLIELAEPCAPSNELSACTIDRRPLSAGVRGLTGRGNVEVGCVDTVQLLRENAYRRPRTAGSVKQIYRY